MLIGTEAMRNPCAAGNDEHLGLVFEAARAIEQVRGECALDHAITALRIGHVLTAEPADAAAHVAIDLPPNERHLAHVVHPRADEETGLGRGRGGEKAADLFRQMLAVGIEQDDELDLCDAPASGAGRS